MNRKEPRRTGRLRRKSRIKPMSDKRRKRIEEAAPKRKELCESVGRCELCRLPTMDLAAHEIPRGNRDKCLDVPAVQLVLCSGCHKHIHDEPALWCKPRQLALLRIRREGDFCLDTYNSLAIAKVTMEEVDMSERILRKRLTG